MRQIAVLRPAPGRRPPDVSQICIRCLIIGRASDGVWQMIGHPPDRRPGARLNTMTVFPRYGDFHVKEKTVARPSYLLHGNSYIGKTTSMRRSPDSDRWYAGCHEYWSMSVIDQGPVSISEKTTFVRSRKVSKPWDLYLELSDRSEIWQALRQHWCRCACQISKRYDNLKYQSRGFEISRDLTKRRLFGYWDGAQDSTGSQRSVPMGVLSTSWWQQRDIYLMTKSLPHVGNIITHVESSQCLSRCLNFTKRAVRHGHRQSSGRYRQKDTLGTHQKLISMPVV